MNYSRESIWSAVAGGILLSLLCAASAHADETSNNKKDPNGQQTAKADSQPVAFRSAAQPAPNIVLFLVDDLGVMDTSVPFLTDSSGQPKRYRLNKIYRTPNMERLAAQGIRLNNFCAMSLCSPTRISIMTGQNAARHRTTNWISPFKDNGGPLGPPEWNWKGLTRQSVTLPRLLQAAGYRTIHVGKGHFGPHGSEGSEPKNLGFDINVAGGAIGRPSSHYGKKNFGHGQKNAPRPVPGLKKYHGTNTYLTEALTIEAKRHVAEAVEEDKPFFLYMSHYAVHFPFEIDPRFDANYRETRKGVKARAFATMIEGIDKSLGDILDQLDTLGVADNTLVLFLGDNGTDAPLGHRHQVACAAPLRGKKATHYEGGMRVPFIAAWAKESADNPHQQRLPIAKGVIQSQIATVYDLFPTILAFTHTESPARHVVDGAPLNTLLTGKPDKTREETFLMHYPHGPHQSSYFTSYREAGWKVIYHYHPSGDSGNQRYQLFHLAEDPFESQNVATSEPEQLRRMMQGLIASLKKYDALYPLEKQGNKTPLLPQLP